MLASNPVLDSLSIKLYADLADLNQINYWAKHSFIKGLTTNPSILSEAGIYHYEKFARNIIDNFPELPVSFEILADDFSTMIKQAKKISQWGKYVYVKIPILNCLGYSTTSVIQALISEQIGVNITAIMTERQITDLLPDIEKNARLVFSVFCGRIADTGRDPALLMKKLIKLLNPYKNTQLLWASPRETLNIFQAEKAGCHIITLTQPLLNKLNLLNKNLHQYSIETIQQFNRDGQKVNL